MTEPIHAKTFGPDGSYPRALCGYRGATRGRMRFCAPRLLPDHPQACPACVAEVLS